MICLILYIDLFSSLSEFDPLPGNIWNNPENINMLPSRHFPNKMVKKKITASDQLSHSLMLCLYIKISAHAHEQQGPDKHNL